MKSDKNIKRIDTIGFRKLTWLMIVLVFFFAAVGYFIPEHDIDILNLGKENISDKKKDDISNRADLNREITAILQNTNLKNKEAFKRALNKQKADINTSFDLADEEIDPAIDELVSIKGSAILCYYLAKDKFNGGCETEKRINSVLSTNIVQNILEANKKMENTLNRLNDTLAQNTTEMRVKLASVSEPYFDPQNKKAQAAFKMFISDLNGMPESLKLTALNTLSPTIGLVLSGLLVKRTWRMITSVLGSIVSRFDISSGVALGSASADGPLPVGDIIGLVIEAGGTIWCVYDLYNAQVTLKNKVKYELKNGLAQYRNKMLQLSRNRAEEVLKEYSYQYSRLAINLKNQL